MNTVDHIIFTFVATLAFVMSIISVTDHRFEFGLFFIGLSIAIFTAWGLLTSASPRNRNTRR